MIGVSGSSTYWAVCGHVVGADHTTASLDGFNNALDPFAVVGSSDPPVGERFEKVAIVRIAHSPAGLRRLVDRSTLRSQGKDGFDHLQESDLHRIEFDATGC